MRNKKSVLTRLILVVVIFILNLTSGFGQLSAQISSNALGLRFGGDGTTNGVEISYQKGLGSANRLELDLGINSRKYYRNMYLAGIYQWHWNIKGGFNWYVGPGAALGFYDWDDTRTSNSGIYAAVGGQIGIEYNFNKLGAPILVSIDARPMWEVAGYQNGLGWGGALGIRYTW